MNNQKVYYNAWDIRCKKPFGAVMAESSVLLHMTVDQSLNPTRTAMILRREGGKERRIYFTQTGAGADTVNFDVCFSMDHSGLYFYRFEIETPSGILFVGRDENAGAVIGDFLPEWQLTVYEQNFTTPEELQQGIMYQIFPDRFLRGSSDPLPPVRNERYIHRNWNERPLFTHDQADYEATDFYGGDLKGITMKLPYLKGLGVTLLYMNPIFEAAGNHRYNTGDYLKIDPYLGTEEDFETLCSEAEKLGIRVVLDGVFSHTGSDSVYFNKEGHYDSLGAFQSPDSPYASWYHFYGDNRSSYDCWWGFTTLPNVNEVDPAFLEFICGENGVLRHWMKKGAYGWRLDVADELPDKFLKCLRKCVKDQNPDAYILGEVWEDASIKCSYGVRRPYLLGEELDSVMNYPWRLAILNFMQTGCAKPFYTAVMNILDHYPAPALATIMTPLSTHDCARALTMLGVQHDVDPIAQGDYKMTTDEYIRGKELFRQASILQYTLPGYPSLYYGDEAGLNGFEDPWNRRCFPWGDEDLELTDFFRKLGQLRTDHPQDFEAPLHFVHLSEHSAAYTRGSLLIVVNRAETPLSLSIPVESVLLAAGEARARTKELTVGPCTAAVFERRISHARTYPSYWRSSRGLRRNGSDARRPFKGKIHSRNFS